MTKSNSDLLSRQTRLSEKLEWAGLKALAVNAGLNFTYLTGLNFHRMERPAIALFAPNKPVTLIVPGFEVGKAQKASFPVQIFSYGENPSSWPEAFRKAAAALDLEGSSIGVESGQLRVFELRLLEMAAPGAVFPAADAILNSLRVIKDNNEINAIQKAVDIAQEAFLFTIKRIKIGMTELELASELTMQLLQAGSDSEVAFPPIIASGSNSANPHATPSDRRLEIGDVVIVDWGARHQGYISDLSRTIVLGRCDPEMEKIAKISEEANIAGCSVVRPGVLAGEIDRAARDVIERAGYGAHFQNRTGHGIGLDVHEEPYLFGENRQILVPGMTLTVEPGIYLEGRGGVRFEDNVVVTENGANILSDLPRQLMVVPL
jgi:Xaa-Pro dipeptidase